MSWPANFCQISGGAQILEQCPPHVSRVALDALLNLHVEVKHQTRVIESNQLSNGQQELTLKSGEKMIVDMYIPTFIHIRNSSYIPAKLLNAEGAVMVDESLKAKGARDVWAIGDISDAESLQQITCDRQSAYVGKAIGLILKNKTPGPYKPLATRKMPPLSLFRNAANPYSFYGSSDWQGFWNWSLWRLENS